MKSRRVAGLLFGLPLLFSLPPQAPRRRTAPPRWRRALRHPVPMVQRRIAAGPHRAGGSTQAVAAATRLGDRRRPPRTRLTPTAVDEGAGWEAAVEAAQSATPLIGVEQTKAVQRINAYFNNITNLQGSFEQVDSTNKRTTGRFYVQRPGKIRIRLCAAERLAHHRRRKVSGDRGFRSQDGGEIPHRVDAVQAPPGRRGRSRPRCPHRRGREPGGNACRSRSKTSRATPPAVSGWCSTARQSSS